MIVRTLQAAEHTDRHVVGPTWESTRLLLKADGMGFSFHITTIHAGTETPMEYRNHLEAVYCGSGLDGLATGIRLQAQGHQVTILEKRDKSGGRAYVYEQDGFRFDGGPTNGN